MTLFQTIFVPLCALAALVTLSRTVRGHVLRRNGYAWTAVWLAAALFITFPTTTTTLARWVGIGRGTDLVLYLAILAGLAASLHFYTRYRRLETIVTTVIRQQALSEPIKGSGEEPMPLRDPADHTPSPIPH